MKPGGGGKLSCAGSKKILGYGESNPGLVSTQMRVTDVSHYTISDEYSTMLNKQHISKTMNQSSHTAASLDEKAYESASDYMYH